MNTLPPSLTKLPVMNAPHETGERLSAFLDGELAADEIDALLDSLDNAACRGQMLRFGASRCDKPTVAHGQLAQRICASVRAEAAQSLAPQPRWRQWIQWRPSPQAWVPASGLAVAAAVGAVSLNLAPLSQSPAEQPVVAAVKSLQQPVQPPLLQAAASGPAVRTVALTADSAAAADTARELVIPAPPERRELDQLYLQHARFRGGFAMSPPASLARAGAALGAQNSAASDR